MNSLLGVVRIVVVSFLVPGAVPAQDEIIFSDGFESGDLAAWTRAVGEAGKSCLAGPRVTGTLAGDLGPAPAGSFELLTCVEIANDQPFERRGEVAYSGIPLPRAAGLLDVAGLALIGPGKRRLAAQFDVLSRWGGPVDDVTLPIRWLEISVRPRVPAGGTAVYELRRYASLPAASDAFAVSVTAQGSDYVVDTGLATFVLDPASPALLERIDVDLDDDGAGRVQVYGHTPGAGPRLEFDPGGGSVVLDTSDPARVTVDPGGFELVERGPVKAVAVLRGHFSAPGGASLCVVPGVDTYERFGYTAVATFTRGSRGVGLQVNVRNECSDASGGSWTDEAVAVRRASWELPFTALSTPAVYYAGGGEVAPSAAHLTLVEQRKGAGNPWRRRARVLLDGVAAETSEKLVEPLAALAGADVVVAASMPWMRFREPQALAVEGETLSLRFVSEELTVGEGKGLWNFAALSLVPAALAGPVTEHLESLRSELRAELERGLLVRAPRGHVDASRLFASLGTDAPSPIKAAYVGMMNAFHTDTVEPGGQWDRAKTFGSQVWPDVQFDPWAVDFPSSPADNDVAMNYWNPSGAELLEYLRTGDPKWVWDFALPQSRLQTYTAYVNIGEHDHGNRNGVAATSGGAGEGQWHRSAFGSDDYSYNAGMHLAYAVRPSPALSDRFAQAGRMIAGRYGIPHGEEEDRERFVNQVDVTRQVIQHFEMLADCAELVPGSQGRACHDRLQEVLAELAEDNLRAGLMCQGDVPSATVCGQPQKFMQNALMYPFFHRLLLNYGDVAGGRIATALVGDPLNYYVYGMPKLADGVGVDVGGEWASILECSLAAGGTEVSSCAWIQNGDGNLLWHNKPHTVALLLMAHELDPSIGLCQVAKEALDDPSITVGWTDNLANDPGWWKAAAQMMQSMVFGVGVYDTCRDP